MLGSGHQFCRLWRWRRNQVQITHRHRWRQPRCLAVEINWMRTTYIACVVFILVQPKRRTLHHCYFVRTQWMAGMVLWMRVELIVMGRHFWQASRRWWHWRWRCLFQWFRVDRLSPFGTTSNGRRWWQWQLDRMWIATFRQIICDAIVLMRGRCRVKTVLTQRFADVHSLRTSRMWIGIGWCAAKTAGANMTERWTRMGCGRCFGHIFRTHSILVAVVEPIEYVQHGLWILLLLLFADVGVHQESGPCFGHASEFARDRIEAHVNGVLEIGWIWYIRFRIARRFQGRIFDFIFQRFLLAVAVVGLFGQRTHTCVRIISAATRRIVIFVTETTIVARQTNWRCGWLVFFAWHFHRSVALVCVQLLLLLLLFGCWFHCCCCCCCAVRSTAVFY